MNEKTLAGRSAAWKDKCLNTPKSPNSRLQQRPATNCSGSKSAPLGCTPRSGGPEDHEAVSHPDGLHGKYLPLANGRGVARKLIFNNGLGDVVEVDSAGTTAITWVNHPIRELRCGGGAWLRSLATASAQGGAQDLDYFDSDSGDGSGQPGQSEAYGLPEQRERIRLFMDYSQGFDDDEVPDPYYGLGHGFDLVLDMVEDAAQAWSRN